MAKEMIQADVKRNKLAREHKLERETRALCFGLVELWSNGSMVDKGVAVRAMMLIDGSEIEKEGSGSMSRRDEVNDDDDDDVQDDNDQEEVDIGVMCTSLLLQLCAGYRSDTSLNSVKSKKAHTLYRLCV
ncbi:uncharacterized protein MEPE_03297 [Melanopsichium pennsylvanicum]|uniref:Uncharacterized protein n=1 Tax=Melanopsichium pennsylvanicum TaxID=63383 RepID=A0AAJ4XLZ3_9BASI|nr:uncharacterized protein MEPE_03297 [Melanopsichium pennsylvanicum]